MIRADRNGTNGSMCHSAIWFRSDGPSANRRCPGWLAIVVITDSERDPTSIRDATPLSRFHDLIKMVRPIGS